MEAVFTRLMHMSLSASWLILAVLLLRPLLKKAPRWVFCLLWGMVALRLICPFGLESRLSLLPAPDALASLFVLPKAKLCITLWLSGTSLLLLYGWISALRLRRSVREAIRLEGNAYLCDWVPSPFILGIIKPRIYLPSDLEPEQVPYVLAHERAHLRRRDHWWKPAAFALLAAYWFNPLVWAAYILLCRDIELACDEAVVEEMSADDKRGYSLTLLACSSPRSPIAACPLAFGSVGVKGRVKNVLNFRKPAFWILAVSAIAAIILTVSFLTEPKTEPEDLSFLNYKNLISLAEKQETLTVSNGSRKTAVKGSELASFLRKAKWKEIGSLEPEWDPNLTVQFYDFLKLQFFNSDPGMTRVVCGADTRYYAITSQEYADVRELLLAGISELEDDLPILTLRDVLELSVLGDDLTKSALDKFRTEDSRFGWVYPINGLFSLWAGDVRGDRPGYVRLRVNDQSEDYIDIRYGDVSKFIEKYRDTLLHMACREAVAVFAENQPLTGDIASQSYEILASESSEQNGVTHIVLYIQALYAKYRVSGGSLSDCSSLCQPMILNFTVDTAGTCTLTHFWLATGDRDPEIRDRFPQEAADKLLRSTHTSYLMEQADRYAQKKLDEYLAEGVDIP